MQVKAPMNGALTGLVQFNHTIHHRILQRDQATSI